MGRPTWISGLIWIVTIIKSRTLSPWRPSHPQMSKLSKVSNTCIVTKPAGKQAIDMTTRATMPSHQVMVVTLVVVVRVVPCRHAGCVRVTAHCPLFPKKVDQTFEGWREQHTNTPQTPIHTNPLQSLRLPSTQDKRMRAKIACSAAPFRRPRRALDDNL